MEPLDVQIVLDQYAATNEGDFERAMGYYADDVELVVHPDAFIEHGTFRGRRSVGRWFAGWFTTFEPGYHFDIEEATDLGDVVLLMASHHGTGKTSGLEVRGRTAYLYSVRDGEITRVELYPSREAAMAAADGE
jgi:ketosteroid isomerase-like protein